MAFDFLPYPRPRAIDELWDRLVRLVTSSNASVFIRNQALAVGANLIPHNQATAPKFFSVQTVGKAVNAANLTKDPDIGPRFLAIHSDVVCTVDIELKL